MQYRITTQHSMTPNKALQSKQPAPTTTNTKQPVKASHSQAKEVEKVDNPFLITKSVNALRKVIDRKVSVCAKYGIREAGLLVLLRIVDNWTIGNGSTIYSVSVKREKSDITSMHQKVTQLHRKGLIEVVGTGFSASRVFAPTEKGIGMIREICNL